MALIIGKKIGVTSRQYSPVAISAFSFQPSSNSDGLMPTESIPSPLSRVWLFGDVAEEHLAAGEIDAARAALRRGLGIAEGIDNPWGRARAVARMAATLTVLTESRTAGA